LTAEERKRAFQEEVKRRQMEEKPKSEASESVQPQAETEDPPAQKEREATEGPANDVVKEATAEAEKAAAVDAGDKESEQAAETAEAAEAAVAHAGKEASDVAEKEETEEERMDRMIAEMEAKEKEDEEREQVYEEKRKKEKEEKAKLEAEKAAKEDEELKRQEREAEEREEQREREREAAREADKGEDTDDQAKDMFAALKKSNLGPGASTPGSGTETPASEEAEPSSMPPPAQPASQTRPAGAGAQKPKPAHLKLETSKRVEPAEPTPGMQALKSARFLEVKEEAFYPAGVSSPNPALNTTGLRQGRAYDKSFLLQFKDVFREKPSIDWDQKVKDTLGSSEDSARPQSARTPSTNVGRSASGRPGPQGPMASFGGPMGAFGTPGNRTIPPGTTSQERFQASQQGMRPGMGNMQMGRVPSQFGGMPPGVGMSRTNSLQTMSNMVPGSPRQGSTRGGKGGSRRGDRTLSKREEADMAAKMPLTAHLDVKGLEKSTTGWKASSLGQGVQAQHDPSGHLAPDMVQRKVKAALNKMTPSTFDRISDQILEIAAQSKTESDGRTLRQVIQLTFEKACDEAHWAGMYAQFCQKMLTTMSTEIRDETINDKNGNPVVGGALFRKYLLNRCQEEFERGWQVNLPDKPEGESQEAVLLSDEYYVAAAAKRRGLGLIQFIGQLYKLRMLTLRIMHECVMKLLNFEGDPDESAVENLTTLLKSVGATMEEDEQGTKLLDTYFERIEGNLLKSEALPSRPKFMLLDLVDLRRARWKGKDDSKGPKTINQIHAEAEAQHRAADLERQRTAARGPPGGRPPAGRGDARNFSGGMPPPQPNLVGSDDLRRLQNRQNRPTGGGLGPGGSLGPGSSLGARTGSRRGNLGPPSSGNTTRTNTPPVEKEKKEEPSAQNAFR
jgi:translation initiation factor 4G